MNTLYTTYMLWVSDKSGRETISHKVVMTTNILYYFQNNISYNTILVIIIALILIVMYLYFMNTLYKINMLWVVEEANLVDFLEKKAQTRVDDKSCM